MIDPPNTITLVCKPEAWTDGKAWYAQCTTTLGSKGFPGIERTTRMDVMFDTPQEARFFAEQMAALDVDRFTQTLKYFDGRLTIREVPDHAS